MGRTKSLVLWEYLQCVSLLSVTEVLLSSRLLWFQWSALLPWVLELPRVYQTSHLLFVILMNSAMFPTRWWATSDFLWGSNFLCFFSLWTNIIRAWLAVLEGFQNKMMCSVWGKHVPLVDSHLNSSIWKRRLQQFPLWQESLGDVLWPELCKKSD